MFDGLFSRSTFDRTWQESGLKDFQDSLPSSAKYCDYQDDVIEMMSSHVDYLKMEEDCNSS
eukprot:1489846-Ditylum_brightwellii.AAC.1